MSRKSYWKLVVGVLAVAALACADVQAQGRGGPGGRRGGRGFGGRGPNAVALLGNEKVQEEIELSEDQIEDIQKSAEEQRANRRSRGDRPNFREMSEEERQKAFAEMRERAEKSAKEAKEKLEEILLPHQVERLEEISIQMRGATALLDTEVAKKLGLSEEVTEKLRKVMEDSQNGMREKMRELFGSGDRGSIMEKMKDFRKEINDGLLATLSESQRKSFEELKGEKFEIPEELTRFGGRGGPGGRRAGGRGGQDGEGGGRRRQRPERPDDN